jgi:FkbM family methyltransferase
MPDLLQYLNSISPEPYDCIVHVGAGADACANDYAAVRPKHVVLIEADSDAYAVLAERFNNSPDVTVIQALVAASAGEVHLRRYTLPSLNAPLGLGRLRELYPRIEEIESIPLQVHLIQEIIGDGRLGSRNLLILDIPGQEAAILRSAPPDFLGRFSNLIAITAAQAWQQGTESAQTTLNTLKESHFELVRESGNDPAWPQFLLKHDSAKAALKKELEHRARLLVTKATQIHQQTEQIAALTTERDALAARVFSLESENSDLATRHTSLVTTLDELQGHHSSLDTRLSTLATEHSSLVAERDALLAQRNSLLQERDALSTRVASLEADHATLTSERSTLTAEHSDLATRHQQLVTALEELQGQHSSLIAERDALVTEREALQSDLAAKTTLLDVLTKGRMAQDEQMEKLLQEQRTLISERDVLASRVSGLTAQIEKLEAHSKLIDEEFGKAEGQIELIKDIFLRETIR